MIADLLIPDDTWGALSEPNGYQDESIQVLDPDEIICEDELPFTRFKPPPDEEDIDTIRTTTAWVVDVPESRHLAPLLKWLKQSSSNLNEELGHLKRVRKHPNCDAEGSKYVATFLVTTNPELPKLPDDLGLSEPYVVKVPTSAALTLTSLALKSSVWPTIYAPKRKGEIEPWSRAKLEWAMEAVSLIIREAIQRKAEGELPIIAYVPVPFEPELKGRAATFGFDTRLSTSHPLRHAVVNAIRRIADQHVSLSHGIQPNGAPTGNGVNYQLTSHTIFLTHEPCIMCSMSLLHSRVKEVFFLIPMPKTGACGGLTCLPALPGVNHRFGIAQWKLGSMTAGVDDIQIDSTIDV